MMGYNREKLASAEDLRELAKVRASEINSDYLNKHWKAVLRVLKEEAESGHFDAIFPAWDSFFPDLCLWPNEVETLKTLGYKIEEKSWLWQKTTVVSWK